MFRDALSLSLRVPVCGSVGLSLADPSDSATSHDLERCSQHGKSTINLGPTELDESLMVWVRVSTAQPVCVEAGPSVMLYRLDQFLSVPNIAGLRVQFGLHSHCVRPGSGQMADPGSFLLGPRDLEFLANNGGPRPPLDEFQPTQPECLGNQGQTVDIETM